MTSNQRLFTNFTNRYALSKTLRFELVPQGKTSQFVKPVFEEDTKIEENYRKTKGYLDALHREFVRQAFASIRVEKLKLNTFASAYTTLLTVNKKAQTKNQKSAYEKAKVVLLREIVELFDATGDDWKKQYELKDSVGRSGKEKKITFTSTGYKILTDEAVLNILMDVYPKEKETFISFFGFFTYFGKFNETRENFYKSDGTSTAVATRVIENFEKFLRNKRIVETEYKKEKNNIGLTDSEIISLIDIDQYKDCFLQAGIDAYNEILGGHSEIDQSVNKKVNEYRQKTGNKISFLAKLHNQILSEKEVHEMLVIEDDVQLHQKLKAFAETNKEYCKKMSELIHIALNKGGEEGFDWSKIYLSNAAINTLSNKFFLNWSILKGSLLDTVGLQVGDGRKELPDFISIEQLQMTLESKHENKADELFKKEVLQHTAFAENKGHFVNFMNVFLADLDARMTETDSALAELKKNVFWETGTLSQKRKNKGDEGALQINNITVYLNSCRDVHGMIKYFATEYRREWKELERGNDPKFYGAYYEEYIKDIFFPLYNATRNYLTQKPSNKNKVKLNFESGQLLSGWDKNKEKEKLGVILRKDDAYYLVIMRKQFNDIFDEKRHPEAYHVSGESYAKMEYKLFPDPKRMIPKVAFAKSNIEAFECTPELQKIKEEYATFQESKKEDKDLWKKQFDKKKIHKLIAYYQKSLVRGGYHETFGLTWKDPEAYNGIGEFNDDIARQNYKVKFVPIDATYVDACVERGEMYLFRIICKDFSEKSSGKMNIHSLYFLQLFSDVNLALTPTPIQLAGAGEIFYRESSVDEKNEIITKKNERKIGAGAFHFKRFTEPKIFFHVSIKINAGAETVRSQYHFNRMVNTELIAPHAQELCVIGIDRGEKHLAYYSVVDAKGKKIDEGSFNTINGIEYHRLLNEREQERQINQKSWLPARQIKDLKKGFVGHAIKKIVDLTIEHNAIVVLEDLNMRFKQVRSGIEKSTYQQLEKALIEKLGYLVIKGKKDIDAGGILHGYQLAAPFESFKDMSKQTGVIFYTEAAYTSTTDPITGFRKNVYISNAAPQEKIVEFIKKCDAIGWDSQKKSYFFTYNPVNFVAKKEQSKTHAKTWTVYADVPRIRREQNEYGVWEAVSVNPNQLLEELFMLWGFVDIHSADMRHVILTKHNEGNLKGKRGTKDNERTFFNSFIHAFNLILQLRNSDTKSAQDYIASPVEPFFSTQDAPRPNPCGLSLANGDSLGAYNIARKGLMTIDRIKENPEKPDLYVSKQNWDEYATNNILDK